jgi:putative ABC transport system permease protein
LAIEAGFSTSVERERAAQHDEIVTAAEASPHCRRNSHCAGVADRRRFDGQELSFNFASGSPFNPERVLTFELAPTALKYGTEEKRAALYQTIIERLRSIPGVTAAGAITSLPIARGSVNGLPIKVEGRSGSGDPVIGGYQSVTADYFRAMEIPLIAGRYFTEGDRAGTANVMFLNQTLAVLDLKNPTLFEVIGVVGDVRTAGLDEAAFEEFYLHLLQYPPASASFAIKTTIAPASLADAAKKAMLEIDRDQPLYRVKTMEGVLADSVADRRFPMLILTAFASTALLLSMLGVYGVVSYTIAQRTHEIGIRVALGAQSLQALRLVIGQGMKLVMFGIAIGMVAAFALTRLMQALLFGVSATDPQTFTLIALLLSSVALLACWIPARRATKVDPMVALHCE